MSWRWRNSRRSASSSSEPRPCVRTEWSHALPATCHTGTIRNQCRTGLPIRKKLGLATRRLVSRGFPWDAPIVRIPSLETNPRVGIVGGDEHVEGVEVEVSAVERTGAAAEAHRHPPALRQQEVRPRQVRLAHHQLHRPRPVFVADVHLRLAKKTVLIATFFDRYFSKLSSALNSHTLGTRGRHKKCVGSQHCHFLYIFGNLF